MSVWLRSAVSVFVFLAVCAVLFAPPHAYPTGSIIEIPQGATIAETAALLKEKNVIAWPALFSFMVRVSAGKVVAGPYFLSHEENAFLLAYRFSHGKSELSPVKVTFPEGFSSREMSETLKENLVDFDTDAFLALAKPEEGYLFPDTYFFLPGANPSTVVAQMKATFARRIEPLQEKITAFGKPESEVIIMASILEKEARQPETRRIVAGILWKRLKLGMPLQVDATFGYIFGKDTYSPKGDDLDIDSPYNTYKYRGLPPGPINNPGVNAIEEAVTPITTPYLYYVTDKEGTIYYGKTLDEHIANIKKAAH